MKERVEKLMRIVYSFISIRIQASRMVKKNYDSNESFLQNFKSKDSLGSTSLSSLAATAPADPNPMIAILLSFNDFGAILVERFRDESPQRPRI